jgi:hypothetical protein
MEMDAAVATKSGGGAGATGVAAAAQAGMNGGETRSRFQRICVYCGSAKGRKPSYQDAAVELGKELVRHAAPPPSPSPQKIPPLRSKNSNLFVGVNHRRQVWSQIKIPRLSAAAILFASLHSIAPLRPAGCVCCCCCGDSCGRGARRASRPWVIMHPRSARLTPGTR